MIHSRESALRCAAAMPRRDLPQSLLDQLDACKDDAARRLILGISK